MSIISWKKPKKIRIPECVFADGAPPGVYVPNMKDEDAQKWKGKVTGASVGYPQIELRKTFTNPKGRCPAYAQVLIIVSAGKGYKYKSFDRDNTKGVNLHISMNGTCQMTFAELNEMNRAIEEAKQVLKDK